MENEGTIQPSSKPPNPTAMTSAAAAGGTCKLQLPAICDPPSLHSPGEQLVWIIFGATTLIGRSVARTAIGKGDSVTLVGHSGREDTVEGIDAVFGGYGDGGRYLAMLADIRIRASVDEVVRASVERWGRVDVIFNCAGYGVVGACEEQGEYEIRDQVEECFLGVVNILGGSLGYFRTRGEGKEKSDGGGGVKSEGDEEDEMMSLDDGDAAPKGGRYIFFSSTCGVPGLGPYGAGKYAVEGLVESMLYETHAFNIKATIVEMGYLRADGDGEANDEKNMHNGNQREKDGNSKHVVSAIPFLYKQPQPNSPYNTPTSPASHPLRVLAWLSSSSASNLAKPQSLTSATRSAEIIYQLAHCAFPPLRLLLGAFAVEGMRDRLRCVIEEIEEWRWLGFGEGEEGEEGDGMGEGRDVKAEDDGGGRAENDGEDIGEEGHGDGDREEGMDVDGAG
ncbi:MAG: hypothetical protein Q9221_008417 [Calogaya cf. arnoldii]